MSAWRTVRRCTWCRSANSRMLSPSSRCWRRILSNSSTLDNSFSLAPTVWQPRSVGAGARGWGHLWPSLRPLLGPDQAVIPTLDRYASLRPLIPHGELAGELRSIARDDERAARDQRRLLNRLRQDLISTFPAALQIAGNDLGAPTILKLLQRWPTAQTLAAAPRHELVAFARAAHHGWPKRLADQVAAALASDQFTPRDYLVRAKADSIRLGATQLLAIGDQRRTWQRRMGALLLGAPRQGRANTPPEDQLGQAFPGGKVYLSFPGLGDRLAARVADEIGDHPEQFESP